MKIDATKIIGIAATVLGVAATLVSSVASDKKMKADIATEVAKQISTK